MDDLFEWQEPPQKQVLAVSERSKPRMRNIRVTERNASEVPIDWLHIRYQRLSRWIRESPKLKPEWQTELEVIKAQLDSRGRSELTKFQEFEQLELDIAVNDRKEYVAIVEEHLREYYRMTLELAWLQELPSVSTIEQSVDRYAINSSLVLSHAGAIGNVDEEQILRDHDQREQRQARLRSLRERIIPITTILQTRLTNEQRELIVRKYLTRESPKDEYLMMKLHVGRQKYYILKKQALSKIAYELGLI